jgi:hypothetical protein
LKRKKVTTNNNSPSDRTTPLCRKCRQPIDPRSEDDFLDKFGTFVRLRCTGADCGHEDWYKGPVLVSAQSSEAGPAGPGEVWIHDVFLGLSFKADNNADRDGDNDWR